MTIIGPGADRLMLTSTNRVLRINGGRVNVRGLTFVGSVFGRHGVDGVNLGEDGGNGEDAEGGGILNYGDLTLTDCMFRFCAVLGGQGGGGGAIFGILSPALRKAAQDVAPGFVGSGGGWS